MCTQKVQTEEEPLVENSNQYTYIRYNYIQPYVEGGKEAMSGKHVGMLLIVFKY